MVVSNFSQSPGGDLCGSRRYRSVVIESSLSILPRKKSDGFFALVVGLLLALHTPVWVALVFYKDKVGPDEVEESPKKSLVVGFLRFLSTWLLDFTPWFANAMLSVFLGILFLCMGFSTRKVATKWGVIVLWSSWRQTWTPLISNNETSKQWSVIHEVPVIIRRTFDERILMTEHGNKNIPLHGIRDRKNRIDFLGPVAVNGGWSTNRRSTKANTIKNTRGRSHPCKEFSLLDHSWKNSSVFSRSNPCIFNRYLHNAILMLDEKLSLGLKQYCIKRKITSLSTMENDYLWGLE